MESAGSVKHHHQVYNNNEHTYNKHTVNIQYKTIKNNSYSKLSQSDCCPTPLT